MSDHEAKDNDPVEGSVEDDVDEKVDGGAAAHQLKVEVKAEVETTVEVKTEVETNTVSGEETSMTMAFSKANEPPTFVSELKSYAEYKSDLLMWSRITSIPKKNQAEVVVYNLDGHPSRIKEKIVLNIGEEIQDAVDGIQKLITYLDSIYKVDDMADAWLKYKNFQKLTRTEISTINDFIAEFEKEYILAKSAGCEYNDIILGFRLLEATRLTDMDEKFVLTGVDYAQAKTQKNLFDQVKASLKKFQGRKVINAEDKLVFDPVLVANVAETLIAQGWSKPKTRRRSTSDPGEGHNKFNKNKNNYKGKKNPLGADGKPRQCFKCGSIYHFIDTCDKKDVPAAAQPAKKETGLVAVADNGLNSVSNSDGLHMIEGHEIIMVINTERELCLLVREAGERGVIDSACSKTVAGETYVANYISKLPPGIRSSINEGVP